jgi:hypothetical protein
MGNMSLIPPVTILLQRVRDNVHSDSQGRRWQHRMKLTQSIPKRIKRLFSGENAPNYPQHLAKPELHYRAHT